MTPSLDFLDKDVTENLSRLGGADILVGIPSYNNARTIGHVVRSVQAGLAKYFPHSKSVIVNSDGGSTDGTREVVSASTLEDPRAFMIGHEVVEPTKIITPYHGLPGKGSAFRTIFAIAELSGAKACVVVDSDLRSITPEWIELLVKPVLEGSFDYVSPMYKRHKYDGTITNNIVYPLTRALYGRQIRQPIGGDFGFSGKLASFYLSKDVWESDVARFGIDIWMTTTAVANGFKVCQSFLGAKIHDAKDPGADLSAMLYQVTSALFDLMGEYAAVWEKVETTEPVPLFGFQYEVGLEPIAVNIERMLDKFRLGVRELKPFWEEFISPDVMELLSELSTSPPEGFGFQDELWARAIYDFALEYHRGKTNRGVLLKSLTPLYLGKVASLVLESADYDAQEFERRVEGVCRAFELGKSHLINRWDSPVAGKPETAGSPAGGLSP